MISALLIAATLPLRILFIGNSHTSVNDVPATVCQVLGGAGHSAKSETIFVPFLESADSAEVAKNIATGKWTHIVLQAQKISSSHRFRYSTKEAIHLAQLGKSANAKVLLYSEWPRKGIDETEFIESIYREIAKPSAAKIVPVGRAWELALKLNPKFDFWQSDGNHAKPLGSFLAALCLAKAIADPDLKSTANPLSLDQKTFQILRKAAKA